MKRAAGVLLGRLPFVHSLSGRVLYQACKWATAGLIAVYLIAWSIVDVGQGVWLALILVHAAAASGCAWFALAVRRQPQFKHGCAAFAARWPGELLKPGELPSQAGLVVGMERQRLAFLAQRQHLLVFAGTGAGKTYSVARPNLLIHQGAAVVLDIKGELVRLLAPALLERGKRVLLYDPEGMMAGKLAAGVETVSLDLDAGWRKHKDSDVAQVRSLVRDIFVADGQLKVFQANAELLASGILALIRSEQVRLGLSLVEALQKYRLKLTEMLVSFDDQAAQIAHPGLRARARGRRGPQLCFRQPAGQYCYRIQSPDFLYG